MTTFQIVSLALLAAVAAWNYMPAIRFPASVKSPNTLRHIEQVMGIRSSYSAPEVTSACTQLLQALLQTKP
jgi:hypothetical protein